MDDVLRGVLEGQARQIQRLEAAVRSLSATDRRQESMIEGAVTSGLQAAERLLRRLRVDGR